MFVKNQDAPCRRDFLKQVSAIGTAGVVGVLGQPLGASADDTSVGHRDVSLEQFSSKIGAEFQVQSEAGQVVTVALKEAAAVGSSPKPGYRQPLSLIFRVPGNVRLPQDTYVVQGAGLRPLRLLLVPVDVPQRYNHLQAIIA